MLAIEVMDATLQGVFFLIAVVLFVIAALYPLRGPERGMVGLVPLGLAFFSAVFCWNAFAAS